MGNITRASIQHGGTITGDITLEGDFGKEIDGDDLWDTFPNRLTFVHNFRRALVDEEEFYLPWSDQNEVTAILDDKSGFLAIDEMELEKMTIRITAHPEAEEWRLRMQMYVIDDGDAVTELNRKTLYEAYLFKFNTGNAYSGGHQVVTSNISDGWLGEDVDQNRALAGQLVFIQCRVVDMDETHASNPIFITTRWKHQVEQVKTYTGDDRYIKGNKYRTAYSILQG